MYHFFGFCSSTASYSIRKSNYCPASFAFVSVGKRIVIIVYYERYVPFFAVLLYLLCLGSRMEKSNQQQLKEACKRLNSLIDTNGGRSALRDKAVLKQSRKIDRLIMRREMLKNDGK